MKIMEKSNNCTGCSHNTAYNNNIEYSHKVEYNHNIAYSHKAEYIDNTAHNHNTAFNDNAVYNHDNMKCNCTERHNCCIDEVQPNIRTNIRNHLITLIPATILFAIGLALNLPGWLELFVFVAAYLLAGYETIYKAFKNISNGKVMDENFLMSIATLGAFIIKEYPEAAAVMVFFKIGIILEDIALNRSEKSIRALIDIRPDYANLKTPEGLIRVDPESVGIGDFIVVKPGERVPLDGTVCEGASFIDASALTGESMPRSVSIGDTVLSGSINLSGSITIKAEKSFYQSAASKILELVRNASSRKAQIENFTTRLVRYYTPLVVAASFFTALVLPIITGNYNFGAWGYTALILLVISCPCALVVSIPLSFFCGIGNASRRGILIKGSNYLEALNHVHTVIFDKTGTLTKGIFKVAQIKPEKNYTANELLEFAAFAEAYSNHPIAKSIIEAYGKSIDYGRIEAYNEISGHGSVAIVDGMEILAGSEKLLQMRNCLQCVARDVSGTVVHIAVNKEYAGYIQVSDEVKADSRKTIEELKQLGVSRIVMLTGDNRQSAYEAARLIGVDDVRYELLPHQKLEQLELLEKDIKTRKMAKSRDRIKIGHKNHLLFVGDGINDAPVLARADIGIAMGGLGSDAAIEASDIVLMTDEPYKLVEAFRLARRTRRIIWQNITFALGVKLALMLLGTIGLATMWEAVFADVGATLVTVINSLRLLKVKAPR